ncbi:translation initiation factor eIF3 subunit 135-domain-containing protein [Globomyces pollinis-pini]|nr:translation initiation factor eIF3 subunit 135-domain-containing protein [Globomyces pollinis-pini]
MLRTSAPENYKPLKQGWILKKGGAGLLALWRPKYMVLVPLPKGLVLWIYDDRDQTKLPKHEILVNELRLESKPVKFARLPKGAVSFTITANTRKFYLATHNRGDYDEWFDLLIPKRVEHQQTTPPAPQGGFESQVAGLWRSVSRQTMRAKRPIDDDARSVYSVASQGDEEDMMSVVSGTTRTASTFALEKEEGSTVSSTVETLSFCSEPVLTPYELTLMGVEKPIDSEEEKLRNQYKKRRAPMNELPVNPETWQNRFLDIMSIRVITEESALQKDVQLMELVGEFQETASFHARNIIDEYHVMGKSDSKGYSFNQDMTISHQGIVYRFACDYDVASAREVELALNRTSAELRGINSTIKAIGGREHDSRLRKFLTVFMTIIDYKGFRVIAHAELGPNRRVEAIHDLNPRSLQINESACEETSAIANYLNLKSHTVQVNDDRRVRICLAATVEIHEDVDTKDYYLTSLQNIFPIDFHIPEEKSKDQSNYSVNPFRRLRPEFLIVYQTPLCADGLTPTSGASRREIDINDDELMKASRFLRENWIPSFVRSLDNLEFCPFDSLSLTNEMHRKGINMRYLGLIYRLSTIPFVRNMSLVEMVARICKQLFRTRLRGAILHFRSVGATSIDEQMNNYATQLLSTILGMTDRTQNFFETKILPELLRKFDFSITFKQYQDIHRPTLFLAIQYHTGMIFAENTDYDFYSLDPIPKSSLISFEPRVKIITGIERDCLSTSAFTAKEDDRLAYLVSRHFKSIGPKSKLLRNNSSSAILTLVATHYNGTNRYEEARLYAQAAAVSAQKNHALFGLATAQLLFAIAGLQTNAMGGPDPSLLGWYRKALFVTEWHWGAVNPLTMTLHDRLSSIYHKAKEPQQAFEFHKHSLEMADKALGKNHPITAGYLTRAGCYLANLGNLDEAVDKFTQALTIFQSSRSDQSLIADVHYHFADVLSQRGDFDGALEHAQKCRKLREVSFGFSDVRVIHACRQVSKMLLTPYLDYSGVLTPAIKAAYREAISCHEKVFRYLQNQQGLARRRSKRQPNRGLSLPSNSNYAIERSLVMSGPLVVAPFGWTPPFGKGMMHKLTKEIVSMKLALVESPVQKETIRTIRSRINSGMKDSIEFEPEDARNAIVKMAAVTPSVYLDHILQRVEHGDDSAVEELSLVIILAESETVGFRGQ